MRVRKERAIPATLRALLGYDQVLIEFFVGKFVRWCVGECLELGKRPPVTLIFRQRRVGNLRLEARANTAIKPLRTGMLISALNAFVVDIPNLATISE